MNKTYQLVAWTHKEQVKMVPSLIEELAKPYVQRIKEAEDEPRAFGWEEETEQLIRLSRAHEQLARFLMRAGNWKDAFIQYVQAATAVTNCSDGLWNDSDYGFFLHIPLEHRFLAMFNLCKQIANEHPSIKGNVHWQKLIREWHVVTDVYRRFT